MAKKRKGKAMNPQLLDRFYNSISAALEKTISEEMEGEGAGSSTEDLAREGYLIKSNIDSIFLEDVNTRKLQPGDVLQRLRGFEDYLTREAKRYSGLADLDAEKKGENIRRFESMEFAIYMTREELRSAFPELSKETK